MIYLENVSAKDNRFKVYQIEKHGLEVRTAWGRFTAHQQKVVRFNTEEETVKFVKKKLSEKIKRGYTQLVYPQGRLF